MEENEDIKYCTSIVEPLIDFPEQLSIDRKVDDLGTVLWLSLAKQDMGKIIGRQGETARAIRLLLSHFGAKYKIRISMKLNEPEESAFVKVY